MKRACTTGRWDRLCLFGSMSVFYYVIKNFVYMLVFFLGLFNDKVVAFLCGHVLRFKAVDFEK